MKFWHQIRGCEAGERCSLMCGAGQDLAVRSRIVSREVSLLLRNEENKLLLGTVGLLLYAALNSAVQSTECEFDS